MNVFLAGMTLTLAAQLADPSAGVPMSDAPAASQLRIAPDLAIPEQPAPAVPETAGAGGPGAAEPTATVPLRYEPAPPQTLAPDPAPPQRSVLAPFIKPTDLMQELMKPPVADQLSGVPMTLGEAVRDARTRQEQTVRAKAYWDLAAAAADYHLALLENMELSALRQGIAAPATQWDARIKEAESRVAVAKQAAQAAQLRLHQLLGGAVNASLPVPADAPHCGRYNAEYDVIFASQPSALAEQLSNIMPLRYASLRSQAQAIADAKAWRDDASRRRDPAGDGLDLLQSQDLLSLHRRTFVDTAREYNHEIAQYIELAAPADVAPDRLVAMMIRTSTTADDLPWRPSEVEPASAEEPVASNAAEASVGSSSTAALPIEVAPSQTNSNEGYREVRRPLQRLLDRGREHSILRRPVQRLRNVID